jgi:transcription termination factor Rho
MGIKVTSRMRKADLVDAIAGKATKPAKSSPKAGSSGAKKTVSKKTAPKTEPKTAPVTPERAAEAGGTTADGAVPAVAPVQPASRSRKSSAAESPDDRAARAAEAAALVKTDLEETSRKRSRRAGSPAGAPVSDSATGTESAAAESGERRDRRAQTGQSGQSSQSGQQGQQGASGQSGSGRSERQAGQGGDRQSGQGPERQSSHGSQGGDRQQQRNFNDDDDRGGRRRGRRDRYRDRKQRQRDVASLDEVELREDDVLIPVAGILDIMDNYAFVRTSGYLPGNNDVYVSLGQVRKAALREGDAIVGAVRQPREGEPQGRQQKFKALVRLDTVNGMSPEEARKRPEFASLTPLYPQERLKLETAQENLTTRVIDLISPIGKGQRGLIVSPPKAGKTMIMQAIANAIAINNPEVHLMVVLVDERPEEVTDPLSRIDIVSQNNMKRSKRSGR